ncbi:hypothetical protein NHX12_015028 [Muraenolepis orangiensis]|uniref:Uncharacterized protein n=1 Tax=Muraenolepis orangiensis TaxID=630683 RepID=A0A9Q0I4F5_9TELE|nr:hypothetical protein NHX12_015028 [Muraenolepis orangiensis]
MAYHAIMPKSKLYQAYQTLFNFGSWMRCFDASMNQVMSQTGRQRRQEVIGEDFVIVRDHVMFSAADSGPWTAVLPIQDHGQRYCRFRTMDSSTADSGPWTAVLPIQAHGQQYCRFKTMDSSTADSGPWTAVLQRLDKEIVKIQ